MRFQDENKITVRHEGDTLEKTPGKKERKKTRRNKIEGYSIRVYI